MEIARVATGVHSDFFFICVPNLHLGVSFGNLVRELYVKELINDDVGFIFNTWESVEKKLLLRVGKSQIELL